MKGKIFRLATIFLVLMALLVSATPMAADPVERVNVLVGFNNSPGPNEQALIHRAGGNIKYTYKIIPAMAISVPINALPGLSHNPNVTVVEPEVFARAIDIELDNAWGVQHIGAGQAHDAGYTGQDVDIAIIDTGIDLTHSELALNYAGGYDFVNDDSDPFDDHGHGTHLAGIIGALDNDVGVVGVAPNVNLWALKVLDSSGSGSFFDIIAALDWATGNNPEEVICYITNNSYGSVAYPGSLVEMAFDYAYSLWGQLHIAAAGNMGVAFGIGDNVLYPARFDSTIAVAATDQSDLRKYWSSTGPDVELSAPGVSIYSTFPPDTYKVWNGTSMACPHVAGTAALVWASGIEDANENGFINDEVRGRLTATADDLGDPGRDNLYGWGLVNSAAAVLLTPLPPPPPPAPPEGTTGVDEIETGVYVGKKDVVLVDRKVSAQYDDCRMVGTAFQNNPPILEAGYFGSRRWDSGSGLRFQDITIPQGATIIQAYLRITASYTKVYPGVNTRISAWDVDDAESFENDCAGSFMTKWQGSRTTARVDWDNIPAWTKDVTYQSPEIKPVIQELVDQPGFASGHAIVIFWDDLDSRSETISSVLRRGYSHRANPEKTAELHVFYLDDPSSGSASLEGKYYVPASTFDAGDTIVVRTKVIANVTELPLANATVEITITGPETLVITTTASESDGYCEATWKTHQIHTTPGDYVAAVTGVTADGYDWDCIEQSTEFEIS